MRRRGAAKLGISPQDNDIPKPAMSRIRMFFPAERKQGLQKLFLRPKTGGASTRQNKGGSRSP
jgi:hypothetical protein